MTGDSADARSVPVAVDPGRASSRCANGQRVRTLSKGVVGFVGLGRMGTAMAANLVAAGRPVVAHVRHPERLSELKALGLTSTTNMADLFDCEFVVSMLPNDDFCTRGCLRPKPKRSRWARVGIGSRSDPYINEHHQHEGCLPVGCRARAAWPGLRGRTGLR